MPGFLDPPVELWDQILPHADLPRTRASKFDSDPYERFDLRQLSHLSQVNRKWYQALLPYLYTTWSYNGARHSYMSLWKFFLAITTNPDLAGIVETLNIGNWGYGGPYYMPDDLPTPTKYELGLISKAIGHAGVEHLEHEIITKLSSPSADTRDHRPSMALLLASLPNVSTLCAHVPESDPYLQAVLLAASNNRSTLKSLKELYLLVEVPIFENRSRVTLLADLDTEGLASFFEMQNDNGTRICHVQHLYAATHDDSKCLPEDVHALLTLPKALVTLSVSWLSYKFKSGPRRRFTRKISNHQIWSAVQQHADSLETLDLVHRINKSHHFAKDHFDSLNSSVRLKTLSIHAQVLLGDDFSYLTTSLAPSLHSLALDLDTVREEDLPTLLSQLEKYISSDASSLKTLRLYGLRHFSDPYQRITDIYPKLLTACEERAVRFDMNTFCTFSDVTEYCPVSGGGRCRWLWRKTMYMWHSGNTRLAKVQTRLLRRYLGDTSSSSSSSEDGPHWYTTKTHVLPFQDHTGITAYMVFNNRETSILPPLVSFSFYFTHTDACRNQEDLVALHDSIEPVMDHFHARFDMYFLPGATENDCIAHYYGEKATQRDSKSMRREFERVKKPYTPPSTSRLPGMNKEYREDGGRYSGAMCVCTERDWRQSQQLRCIQFGSDEPSLSGQIIGLWRPVSENSPGAGAFDDETTDMWVWNLIIDQRSEYTAAHQKATKKGWRTW